MANEDRLYQDLGAAGIAENVQIMGSKSQDLGLVVTGTAMAAGAIVSMASFVDNLEWVRNALFQTSSDQTCQVSIIRRDRALNADWGELTTSVPATGTSFWQTSVYQKPIGYSAKFGIKNNSASVNVSAALRVQLLGM